jgi:hypothetical protein
MAKQAYHNLQVITVTDGLEWSDCGLHYSIIPEFVCMTEENQKSSGVMVRNPAKI